MSILLSALTEVFFFPLTYPSFFFLFPPVRLPEGQATLSLSITQLLFMMSALFYQLTIILLSHTGTETYCTCTCIHTYIVYMYTHLHCVHLHVHVCTHSCTLYCMCTSIHCIHSTQLHVRTSTVYTYSMYIHINAYSKYLLCINAHIVHHIVHVLAHIQCTHRQTCTHFVYVDIYM